MLTKIMKWVSVGVLLLASIWRPYANYLTVLEFVVCVSGIMVFTQAVRRGKVFWAAGFVAIVVLFNPVLPVVLSHRLTLGLGWMSLAAFLFSLAALRVQPILSMPSITDRTPGSESL
jgi:hypothetical protein